MIELDDYTPLVSSACKMTKKRFSRYVDWDDLWQECQLWLWQNSAKIEEWREEFSEAQLEGKILRSLRNAAERYARREKAAMEGYEPEDEFFYSFPLISQMLQLYLDPDHYLTTGKTMSLTPSAPGNPSEGGNLMAMVADVGRAYEGLPIEEKGLLFYVYGSGVISENIQCLADDWDCTFSAANMRVRRKLGLIRAALGGPSPYVED